VPNSATAATAWQALRGQPLLRPDSATWLTLAVVIGLPGVAFAALWRRRGRIGLPSDRPGPAADQALTSTTVRPRT
jgi:hypothetical protein